MTIPPLTDEERQALVEAAIKHEPKRRQDEKRRRESGRLNSPEATRQRTDFDVFTGE